MNRIKVDWTELQYDIFIIKCISIFVFIFLAVSIVTKNQSSLLFFILFFFFFFFEQILMTADNEGH